MDPQRVDFTISPFFPGESVQEIDRKILRDQYEDMNLLALPLRVAGKGIDKACHSNALMEKVCDIAADTLKTCYEMIPESVRLAVEAKKQNIEDQIVLHNYEVHGIPPEETRYALESLLISAPGSGPAMGAIIKLPSLAAKRVVQTVKQLRPTDPMYRVKKAFQKGWTEFEGELSKDLRLVQFRGEGNSLRWWTTTEEANRFFKVEDASGHLALLSKFGERTHVSFALVPKGTTINFLSGKARFQFDFSQLEFRKGGGKQFYFPDFNPNWVRETRSLPYQVPRVRNLNNLGNKFSKIPELVGNRPLAKLPSREKLDCSESKFENKNWEVLRKPSESSLEKFVKEKPISDLSSEQGYPFTREFLEKNVSSGVQVEPLSLKSSTLMISCKISDAIAAGILFSPTAPRQVQLSLNRDQFGFSVPLANPKTSKISIPISSNRTTSASLSLCPGKPLESGVNGSVTVPVYGVPVTFSGSMTLKHPENAVLGVSLPTFGLDKLIPGLPKQVQVLSISLKKVRHQVQSLAHKIGMGSKRRKKRRKAAAIRARNQDFAVAATKIEEYEKEMARQFERWLEEVPKRAAAAVDEAYAPVLIKEFAALSQDLKDFREKLTAMEELELPLSSYGILRLDLQGACWDQITWSSFLQVAEQVLEELQGLSKAIDDLELPLEKLLSTLDERIIEAKNIANSYQTLTYSFKESEQIASKLVASKGAVTSFLRDRVPHELLCKASEQLRDI